MCPLRFIMTFLYATLVGFFVLKNLKCQQPINVTSLNHPINGFSKVWSIMESGCWDFVDMASGRYLWRHLTSSSLSPKRSS
ncbi:uncharacterized protein LOC119982484 [Tripterygium wilfordii]|uniref:uncharacterized protein LOC119982484 n=1 Tax=Tripterygium wilfordii TaxID=458696 RepID=UPI0018F816B0|nr:uncharacterized protein LOC119982484 [Tripterygium wilfordii]